ncbi:hypothetical protein SAMN05216436_11673 [bacterium A37T11]|nr:hypothetical protein SAMN05216436_11673 [bacterium A37T11]
MFGYKNVYGLLGAVSIVLLGILGAGVETQDLASLRDNDTEPSRRQTLRNIYTAEIGVREASGKNDGVRVQEYLQYTKLRGNFSYCAAFISWVFYQAGMSEPKTAWSPAMFPANRLVWERGKLDNLQLTTPLSGDVFGIYFQEFKRIGHCGFVDDWDETWCTTVEGNTANPIRAGPSQEGVYRKKRPIKTLYKVADWVSDKSSNN